MSLKHDLDKSSWSFVLIRIEINSVCVVCYHKSRKQVTWQIFSKIHHCRRKSDLGFTNTANQNYLSQKFLAYLRSNKLFRVYTTLIINRWRQNRWKVWRWRREKFDVTEGIWRLISPCVSDLRQFFPSSASSSKTNGFRWFLIVQRAFFFWNLNKKV